MSRLFPIASGSGGNCTYIGYKQTGILIDAGVSCKCITEALQECSVDPKTLSGIFITHEHTDHISGLRVFVKKYKVPVFASFPTAKALIAAGIIGEECVTVISDRAEAGGLSVGRFSTSHDCEGSSGYTVTMPDGKKCAVCTDLGVVSDEVHRAIQGCEALIIESNHDAAMLQCGSYPPPLKKRILGETGHLSNVSCAAELKRLAEGGTTRFILGHLSRENNRPEIARSAATAALMDLKLKEDIDYTLYVAPPKNGKTVIF